MFANIKIKGAVQLYFAWCQKKFNVNHSAPSIGHVYSTEIHTHLFAPLIGIKTLKKFFLCRINARISDCIPLFTSLFTMPTKTHTYNNYDRREYTNSILQVFCVCASLQKYGNKTLGHKDLICLEICMQICACIFLFSEITCAKFGKKIIHSILREL